jgi:hypothetical protein
LAARRSRANWATAWARQTDQHEFPDKTQPQRRARLGSLGQIKHGPRIIHDLLEKGESRYVPRLTDAQNEIILDVTPQR